MNREHLELCCSPEWGAVLRDHILPDALANAALGGRVLEIGPGPGLTTDVLRSVTTSVIALERDSDLASALAVRLDGTNVEVVHGDATDMPFDDDHFTGAVSFTMLHHVPTGDLQDRLFHEVGRVLRPGGQFVAFDSVASDALAAFHRDDVYNPIDPAGLAGRLEAAGFASITIRRNDFGWIAHATRNGALC